MFRVATKQFCHYALIAAVCLLCLWPWLTHFNLVPGFQTNLENRRLAQFPLGEGKFHSLQTLPRDLGKFVSDNMPNRNTLIFLHSLLKFRLFSTPSIHSVLVGRDRWLFHKIPSDLLEIQGKLQQHQSNIRMQLMVLEERQAWLAERNIDYLVVIAPTKQTIYPEHLPSWLQKGPGSFSNSRRELLLRESEKTRSPVRMMDLTPTLLEAKKEWGDSLYYKKDTHWNYRGAFEAYKAFTRALPRWFRPIKEGEGKLVPRQSNLMNMMGLPHEETTIYPQPLDGFASVAGDANNSQALIELANKGDISVWYNVKGNGKLYVLADSFFTWNERYLAENFHRTVASNTWGNQWRRHDQFPTRAIELEKPDLVVQQMVENRLDVGHLGSLLVEPDGNNHSPEVRASRLRRLFAQAESLDAPFYVEDNSIFVDVSKSDQNLFVVEIAATFSASCTLESVLFDSAADEDRRVFQTELSSVTADPKDSEIYLVALACDKKLVKIICAPASGLKIRDIKVTPLEHE